LFALTSGSEFAAKSIYLLLFTLVTDGSGGSRRSTCSTLRHQLGVTVIGWDRRDRGWGQRNGDRLAGYF